MKKLLVTGAGGFIGKNMVEQFGGSYDLYAITSKDLDLLDDLAVKAYIKNNSFDVIIHTATHNATMTSSKDLNLVLTNNIRMFMNIYRCRHMYGKMLYYGSGAEYDSRYYVPHMKEDYLDTYVPADDYGFSKYIMNNLAQKTSNIFNLRAFGVYGKYEDWRIRFISNACCRAILDLPISINQNVFLDYLYIDDLVKITSWFLDNEPHFHDYNICTSNSVDLMSIANKINELSGKNLQIQVKIPGLKLEYSGDNSRLLKEIGHYSFYSLDEGIKCLLEWYKENTPCINRDLFTDS